MSLRPPIPLPFTADPRHLLDWSLRLTAWLRFVENELDAEAFTIEEQVAFGGPEMASRLVGFELDHTTAGVNEQVEIVAAPPAGKKRVIVAATLILESATGTDAFTFKSVGGSVFYMAGATFAKRTPTSLSQNNLVITLDGEDEFFGIEVAASGSQFHITGSYLDVD